VSGVYVMVTRVNDITVIDIEGVTISPQNYAASANTATKSISFIPTE
jgi:hypothetical protein